MVELIFLVGLMWAGARAFDNTRTAVRKHTAARRKAVPDAHKRRAARQAMTGWWLGEALHLFPTTRHGLREGWENHRDAWHERQVSTTKRQADHAERRLGWQAEIAAHLHRMEIAAQRYREGPSMSDQLRAAVASMRKRLTPDQPAPHDPDVLPDGQTRGREPDSREAPMPAPGLGCTNPDCDCHKRGKNAAPAGGGGNGNQPGGKPVTTPSGNGSGSGAGEPTFTSVNERCDAAVQEAESIAGPNLEACTTLPDELGAVIRDDSDMMGKATELASAARAFETARKRILDAAQAVKDHNLQHYAPHQDATDSTGVTPERAYTANG